MKRIESIELRISVQQQKLDQLRALQKKIEAQKKATASKASRAIDARKKILVGAAILNAVSLGKMNPDFLNQLLKDGLVKQADRDLFSLPPKITHDAKMRQETV